MTDKEQILNLKDGEVYIILENNYGKAEIWRKHNHYFLFEIPLYGGAPRYFAAFLSDEESVDVIIKTVESWI